MPRQESVSLKRLLSLFFVLAAAVPLSAATVITTSNASQAVTTQEPVISVQSLNGVTHGVVAYMNFPNGGSDSRIFVKHTYDFQNWSAPTELPRTVGGSTYDHSADPVLLEYGQTFPYP